MTTLVDSPHSDHEVVIVDATRFRCLDCQVEIPRDPPRGQLTLGAALELDGKDVSVELGARKEFGS